MHRRDALKESVFREVGGDTFRIVVTDTVYPRIQDFRRDANLSEVSRPIIGFSSVAFVPSKT
jgi:hypothetical protein